jgi:hypothetical protein
MKRADRKITILKGWSKPLEIQGLEDGPKSYARYEPTCAPARLGQKDWRAPRHKVIARFYDTKKFTTTATSFFFDIDLGVSQDEFESKIKPVFLQAKGWIQDRIYKAL